MLALGAAACAVRPTATDPLTLDTHVDIPRTYMREARFDAGTDTVLRVDLGKMERGGLDAAFFVIFVEQGPRTPEGYAAAFAAAERKVSAIEEMVRKYPDRIRLATSPKDVIDNHAAGRLSAMMGIENGFVIGKDLARLDALYARGARYLGLTHTGHNDICTSSGILKEFGDTPAAENVGLSPFGESVVRRANALGMMVDVSHASDACVRDVLRLSAAPIIASHSSARALTNHARNLSDELMRVDRREGRRGSDGRLYRVPEARSRAGRRREGPGERGRAPGGRCRVRQREARISSRLSTRARTRLDQQYPLATLDDYLDHIQHAVQRGGHRSRRTGFRLRWRRTDPGLERCQPDAQRHRGLRRRGFTEAQIAQLWSGNLLRVWRDVERMARTTRRSPARRPSMRSSMR